jgi:hypothetical protein
MREIIFSDSGPRLVFSDTGNLKLLRTGHDGYAEHNDATELVARKICAGLKSGDAITDKYRIAQPALVGFVTLPAGTGTVEAVLGVHQPGGHMFTLSEARPMDSSTVLASLRSFHGDVAASVAWGNFAIGVRGAKAVQALTQLYAAIQTGDVVVVPGVRSQRSVHGIVLANLKELTEEDRALLNAEPDIFLKQSFSVAKVAGKGAG